MGPFWKERKKKGFTSKWKHLAIFFIFLGSSLNFVLGFFFIFKVFKKLWVKIFRLKNRQFCWKFGEKIHCFDLRNFNFVQALKKTFDNAKKSRISFPRFYCFQTKKPQSFFNFFETDPFSIYSLFIKPISLQSFEIWKWG